MATPDLDAGTELRRPTTRPCGRVASRYHHIRHVVPLDSDTEVRRVEIVLNRDRES